MFRRQLYLRCAAGVKLSDIVSSLKKMNLGATVPATQVTATTPLSKASPSAPDGNYILSNALKSVPFYARALQTLSSNVNYDLASKLQHLSFLCGFPCLLADIQNCFPCVSSADVDNLRTIIANGKSGKTRDFLFYSASRDAVVDWTIEGFLRRTYPCITVAWAPIAVFSARCGWNPKIPEEELAVFLSKFVAIGIIQLGTEVNGFPQCLENFDTSKVNAAALLVRRTPFCDDATAEHIRFLGDPAVHPPTKGNKRMIEDEYFARGSLSSTLRSFESIQAASIAANVPNSFAHALKSLEPSRQSHPRQQQRPQPAAETAKSIAAPQQHPPCLTTSPAQSPPSSLPTSAVRDPEKSTEERALEKDLQESSDLHRRVQSMLQSANVSEEAERQLRSRLEMLTRIRREAEMKLSSIKNLQPLPQPPSVAPPPPTPPPPPQSTDAIVMTVEQRQALSQEINATCTEISELKKLVAKAASKQEIHDLTAKLVAKRVLAARLQLTASKVKQALTNHANKQSVSLSSLIHLISRFGGKLSDAELKQKIALIESVIASGINEKITHGSVLLARKHFRKLSKKMVCKQGSQLHVTLQKLLRYLEENRVRESGEKKAPEKAPEKRPSEKSAPPKQATEDTGETFIV